MSTGPLSGSGSGSGGDSPVVVHVVDDDEALRASLVFLLESVGVTALTYPSAMSFLEEFDPDEPAVVVVDVRMPGLSGFQLQAELTARGYPAPVVFCSAHGDIKMSVRAMREGAVDFLEKPYDPQQMLETVQRNLEEARRAFAAHRAVAEVQARLSTLTPREVEVLRLVVEGLPSQSVATRLGTSVKTVDVHRARIKAKTGAESLATLVRDVLRAGVEV